MTIRTVRREDWRAMAELVAVCFEEYAAFAPPGWRAPSAEQELVQLEQRVGAPGGWALVAEDGRGSIAGQVALHDAPDEPRVVHVMYLFLRPDVRGTGLAEDLLERALDEGRRRGARAARLNTPVGQARARRFYARCGWTEVSGPFDVPHLGLPLIELRHPLA